MTNQNDASVDILGIKPISESINAVTKGSVDGASAFLSRICLPAAEEFGLLIKDKVSAWRANNAVIIANKAEQILNNRTEKKSVSAHPRIIFSTVEHGSWAEDDLMQNLWAGLLASSCTQNGKDESNHIFIGILAQLTSNQAAIIDYIGKNARTYKSKGGWVGSYNLSVDAEDLIKITGYEDLHQIDRELDHLRSLELIYSGFHPDSTRADITPHSLCLNLFVRGQGYVGSPIEYFGSKEYSELEDDN